MTLWLRVTLGGMKWRIYLVSPRSKHLKLNGAVLLGACEYSTARIFINRELEESVFHDTLLHELMHAILWVSGARNFYDDDHEKDECVCGAVTPFLFGVLKQLGCKLPYLSKSNTL